MQGTSALLFPIELYALALSETKHTYSGVNFIRMQTWSLNSLYTQVFVGGRCSRTVTK